jgi:uncharacterized tellurite resistance protein B-like protein
MIVRLALYLLALLLATLPLTLVGVAALGLVRAWRRAALHHARFEVSARTARPGDTLAVHAEVRARREQPLHVSAALACTLFDHRRRRLFTRRVALAPAAAADGTYAGELHVPDAALRTGVVGDELSSLFSEEARRLLAFWTVVFEVRRGGARGTLLARRSIAVEVPEGKPLSTDARWMGQVVVETFTSLRDDYVLNWLVRMAAADGAINASERALLHDVLREAHGITDPALADARIAAEAGRGLDLDPDLVRRHVPAEQRVQFYKLLFALAWRDGKLDPREHALLIETLDDFGLDEHHVREVELEVLRGMAAHSLA